MTTKTTDRPAEEILKDLRAKSNLIIHQRSRRDSGKFRSVGDAIQLQKTERERQKLLDELPALRIVT